MATGIPYTGRSYSAGSNECCDVGLAELEAMSVLAGPRLRAGDGQLSLILYGKVCRQSARNTAQRHFSDRGHTQTHLFASECDWSISLIARLARAYLL